MSAWRLYYAAGFAGVTEHGVGPDLEIDPQQLAHVAEMARRSNITLHVLPYTAGLHASMAGSFAVLTFGRPAHGWLPAGVAGL